MEEKEYDIPIRWESYKRYKVNASNLEDAVEKALKQFLSEPDDKYINDSFEIDEIVYFKMFSSCKKYWCRLPVAQYDLKGNLIKIWASLEDASKYYNITTGGLNQAVKGKVKISKNSIWKYFKYQNPWDLKKN